MTDRHHQALGERSQWMRFLTRLNIYPISRSYAIYSFFSKDVLTRRRRRKMPFRCRERAHRRHQARGESPQWRDFLTRLNIGPISRPYAIYSFFSKDVLTRRRRWKRPFRCRERAHRWHLVTNQPTVIGMFRTPRRRCNDLVRVEALGLRGPQTQGVERPRARPHKRVFSGLRRRTARRFIGLLPNAYNYASTTCENKTLT